MSISIINLCFRLNQAYDSIDQRYFFEEMLVLFTVVVSVLLKEPSPSSRALHKHEERDQKIILPLL